MKLIKRIHDFLFHPTVAHLFFWGWNVIYLLSILTLEINEGIFISLVRDVFAGEVPLNIFLSGLVLFGMPILSLIVAVRKFMDDGSKILRWFFCIELPIMFLAFLRLVGFNELTWGNAHFIIVAILGIVTMLFYVLNENKFLSDKWKELKLIGLTSILLLITYICLLLFMLILPLISIFIAEVFKFEWIEDIFQLNDFGAFIFVGLLMILSGILFVVYPLYSFAMYWQTFLKAFQHFKCRNANLTWTVIGIAAAVNISLFFALNYNQPQQYAFDLWERMEKENFPEELKQETLANEAKIKRGIMNAYLANYRYAFDSNDRPLQDLYDEAFGSEGITNAATAIMRGLSFPFMYQGNMYGDDDKARELYGNLFDESLHVAEKDRILNAMNSTWDRSGVEAGILEINEKKVLVTEQNTIVKEQGNFAEIEIHEVYQNQTFQQQEILYYFSLPDNAVFSGLWLSDDDSIAKKYDFSVSPRGAAQQVYKNEVQRRVDPSLLEQVGPNQYRLRAFPILPKTRDYNNDFNRRKVLKGDNFHLWMSYTICVLDNNRETFWPTPEVLERRNVYANDNTKYTLNGKKVEEIENSDWIPHRIKKNSKAARISEVSYDGESVVFEPIEAFDTTKPYELPQGIKVNVLIDNSYSMQLKYSELLGDLSTIQTLFGKENVNIQLGKKAITEFAQIQKTAFWGKRQAMEQVSQFADSSSQNPTIFITDGGSYELTVDELKSVKMTAPLFVYHLGKLAKAYPDNLFETIKMCGGDVSIDLNEIRDRIAAHQNSATTYVGRKQMVSTDGNIAISTFETSKKPSILFPNPLAGRIIGAKIIDNKTKQVYGENRYIVLDELHSIAKKHAIVTPYSSMIVLVNNAQKEALKKAEEDDDRFDRENETGDEPTGKLGLVEVTGTPEPHEWVLIVLSALMLLVFYAHKKGWKLVDRS